MCKCNADLFTKEEYNTIITNDYEFCQGYYKDLKQNLIEKHKDGLMHQMFL